MPKDIIADLHLHTTKSDGRLTPTELVENAVALNLTAIAITDHDTFAGCQEAIDASNGTNLKVITGVEWTALWKGKPHHFLAYGFDLNSDALKDLESKQCKLRLERAEIFRDRLAAEFGFEDETQILQKDGVVCRSHFAPFLKSKLPEKDHDLIYKNYLSEKNFPTIKWPDFEEVRDLVHQAGGIIVLAHPGQRWSRSAILELRTNGLDGIEVRHSSHSIDTTRDYCALAFQKGMIATGGSDWHGAEYHGIHLGSCGLSKSLWKRFAKRLQIET